ncbi:MAG: type II secretion system F family protein [Ruminococcaceae bacterium]|nr:type II secretion system F family protein [Oscillospiraceae bacterium]
MGSSSSFGFGNHFFIFDILIFYICRKKKVFNTGLNVFLFEEVFFIGEYISKHVQFSPIKYGKRVRKLEEIYDKNIAGKIARNATFAPFTYIFLFIPILSFVLILSQEIVYVGLIFFLIIFLCFYFDIWLENQLKNRRLKILSEFTTVLSKMSLLINAGVTSTVAFELVATSSSGVFYDEMKQTIKEIRNGVSYEEALDKLNFRSGCKEVRKFISLYKQNLEKGGPEFPLLLSEMASNAWEERKRRAKIAGGVASQKLLIPIMMMFIGILLMVIVPAFNSFL